MILRDFLPNPSLREYIQFYRICDFKFDMQAENPVKIYPPKPEECLHFILRGNLDIELISSNKKTINNQIYLLGQQTCATPRYFAKDFLNFHIVFQPTGLFRLTGIPSFELTNKYFDAEEIFSKNIRFVFEELQQAKTYSDMLPIANKFVTNLINNAQKNTHLIDSVSTLMIQRGGNISLDWLAKESCLCAKQFKRKFNERTGVNPKTYARIIRFTKAFNTKNAYPKWDWLRIAIECNYFDYQHLVKDYKDFTGLTPNELHLLESNSPERRLGLAEELYRSGVRLE
jgi:AraC-like DNA-binding protein